MSLLTPKLQIPFKIKLKSTEQVSPHYIFMTQQTACHVLRAKSLQSRLTLCDPVDWSPPGSFLPMRFSKQEYCSVLPFPPPVDRPNPGIEPVSLTSAALAGWFFTTNATWEVQ